MSPHGVSATLGFIMGTAAGLRLAMTFFAFMCFLAWHRKHSLHSSWLLIAGAIVLYSPAHASWLMGHPWQKGLSTGLDALACGLVCWAMIARLAYLGVERGLSPKRVRKGVYMNVLILTGFVGAAWLTR